jgi:hypothetical protein
VQTPADRDRRIVELWQARGRQRRTTYDVLAFYGWLTDHEPRLVPPGPESYEYLRQLLAPHTVEDTPQEDGVTGHVDVGVGAESWVITNRGGEIVAASDVAGHLLLLTPRGLIGRSLYLFFDGERTVWQARGIAPDEVEQRYQRASGPRMAVPATYPSGSARWVPT